MKFTHSFAFATFVLSTSTIALPMRDAVEIGIRTEPSSIIENRATTPDAPMQIVERGVTQNIFGFKRELEPIDELYERSLDDEDFSIRSVAGDTNALVERDIPSKAKGLFGGLLGFKKRDDEILVTREVSDDLVERNFLSKLKNIGKGILGTILRRSPTLATREVFDDLVERNFLSKLKNIGKGILGTILRRSPEEALATREVSDDLVERNFFSKLKNIGKGILGTILRRSPELSEQQLHSRTEAAEELFERYHDDELVKRFEDDFLHIRDYELEDEN